VESEIAWHDLLNKVGAKVAVGLCDHGTPHDLVRHIGATRRWTFRVMTRLVAEQVRILGAPLDPEFHDLLPLVHLVVE
jgi:hypothetical protein